MNQELQETLKDQYYGRLYKALVDLLESGRIVIYERPNVYQFAGLSTRRADYEFFRLQWSIEKDTGLFCNGCMSINNRTEWKLPYVFQEEIGKLSMEYAILNKLKA